MATFGLIEYKDASPEVRAVYDDIVATRKVDYLLVGGGLASANCAATDFGSFATAVLKVASAS